MSDCPYYQQGLFIGSTPSGNTEIAMCCWQKKQTVDTVSFDHEYLAQLRTQAQTKVPSECSKYCSIPGHVANEREKSQIEWPALISKDYSSKSIRSLHLEQSLICNLKCISCNSSFSSAWASEYNQYDPTAPTITLKKFPEEKWKDLDLINLQRLHFTGGEPLLNADNKKILQHLDNIGILSNVSISYNTNGTILPDQELIELWQKSKFVRLFISLDGVESTFEYTRYPAKWNQVETNIEYFRSLSSVCILIEISAIIGIHNIFNLPKLFKWWEDNCQTGSQGDPSQIFVRRIEPISYGGQVLDLKHLPESLRQPALDMLQLLTQYSGVYDLINYIKHTQMPSNTWINYLESLDKNRGTTWKSMLDNKLQKEINC